MKIQVLSIPLGKLTFAIYLLMLAVSSCKKESALQNTPAAPVILFDSINTSTHFGWSNVNKLSLNFAGQPDKDYNSVLKVLASDNSIIFQKLQNGSTNFSTTLNIPAVYKTITIVFGGIQKTFITKNGSVTMNLN
jgi:hypothetical protein